MATPLLQAELRLLAGALVTGILLTAAYQLLLLLRELVPHGRLLCAAEDMCFWIASAIVTYLMLYRLGNGTIRYYAAAGMLIGVLLVISIAKMMQKRLQKRRLMRKMKQEAIKEP